MFFYSCYLEFGLLSSRCSFKRCFTCLETFRKSSSFNL
uniref:Uncharacterized protein n=1 Tax=Arundo donax TaxID=35708 RepID=A0A0A9G0F5_ARUDO